jgi:poly(A) polymerase
VAGERVREELLLLLSIPGSGAFLAYMETLGLLTAVFPELMVTKGATQPLEHHWDVLEHSIKAAVALDFLLRLGTWEYADGNILAEVPWSQEISKYFEQEVSHGSTRGTLLKLAGLFHDIAKPETRTVEAGGKVRFLGHAREGAAVAAGILERLRFSTREIRLVETAVKHHLRPTQMGWPELPTRRAIYRYYRDAGEAAIGVLFLSLADHLATRGPGLDLSNWGVHVRTVAHILSRRAAEPVVSRKLVDGYDIMNIFGLTPGPRLGEIMEIVREAQGAGEVATKEEALTLVKQLLAE